MPRSTQDKIINDLSAILGLCVKVKKMSGPLTAKDKALLKHARMLIRKAKTK